MFDLFFAICCLLFCRKTFPFVAVFTLLVLVSIADTIGAAAFRDICHRFASLSSCPVEPRIEAVFRDADASACPQDTELGGAVAQVVGGTLADGQHLRDLLYCVHQLCGLRAVGRRLDGIGSSLTARTFSYNSKISHLPKPSMLNDPMEANALQVYLDCVGAGYTFDCGKVHPIIEEWQNRYRILSVSAIPDSPIMWAHYASGYSGCCLIYSTKKTFSKIEPIIYTDITFSLSDEDFMDEDIPSEAIEESLRFKHKDWAYENEWRLIQNEDAGFLNYEVSELVGIIIGENMSLDKRKVLVKLCKDKCIPCFRTYTMKSWNEIAFAPYDLMESEKIEYITPGEMKRYIQEGLENGRCSNNERMIFNALNEKVLRKEHY